MPASQPAIEIFLSLPLSLCPPSSLLPPPRPSSTSRGTYLSLQQVAHQLNKHYFFSNWRNVICSLITIHRTYRRSRSIRESKVGQGRGKWELKSVTMIFTKEILNFVIFFFYSLRLLLLGCLLNFIISFFF